MGERLGSLSIRQSPLEREVPYFLVRLVVRWRDMCRWQVALDLLERVSRTFVNLDQPGLKGIACAMKGAWNPHDSWQIAYDRVA